jgi:hypothetical protein
MLQRAATAFLAVSALILGLPSLAMAQATAPSSGTKNAINGINSYSGPEFVKYAKQREPQDRRIDLFISDWQGSLPRFEHGSLVLRDILIRGDNLAPSQKSAVLRAANFFAYAAWPQATGPRPRSSKANRKSIMCWEARERSRPVAIPRNCARTWQCLCPRVSNS